jgi:hypothetical protein
MRQKQASRHQQNKQEDRPKGRWKKPGARVPIKWIDRWTDRHIDTTQAQEGNRPAERLPNNWMDMANTHR